MRLVNFVRNQVVTFTGFCTEKSKFFNGAEIEEAVKEAMFLSYVENSNTNQISLKNLLDAIEPITPLSQTMKKKIDALRDWASSRKVRLASNIKNNEQMVLTDEEKAENERIKQTGLTKREREEDIF